MRLLDALLADSIVQTTLPARPRPDVIAARRIALEPDRIIAAEQRIDARRIPCKVCDLGKLVAIHVVMVLPEAVTVAEECVLFVGRHRIFAVQELVVGDFANILEIVPGRHDLQERTLPVPIRACVRVHPEDR